MWRITVTFIPSFSLSSSFSFSSSPGLGLSIFFHFISNPIIHIPSTLLQFFVILELVLVLQANNHVRKDLRLKFTRFCPLPPGYCSCPCFSWSRLSSKPYTGKRPET